MLLKHPSLSIAYITGEEAESQIIDRCTRVIGKTHDNIAIFQSNDCDDIAETILQEHYNIVIVDSIQTIASNRSDSTP
jgi:DNA repair protein RadA/Sms